MELRYNMADSSYLEHYGVLGMKWGVRNDKRSNYIHSRRGERAIRKGDKLAWKLGRAVASGNKLKSNTLARKLSQHQMKFEATLARKRPNKERSAAEKDSIRLDNTRRIMATTGVVGTLAVGLGTNRGSRYFKKLNELSKQNIAAAEFSYAREGEQIFTQTFKEYHKTR